MRLSLGGGRPTVKEVHIVVGALAVGLNGAAGLWGAWRWWRVQPGAGVWPLLRAGQAAGGVGGGLGGGRGRGWAGAPLSAAAPARGLVELFDHIHENPPSPPKSRG